MEEDVDVHDELHGPEICVTDRRPGAVHRQYRLNFATLEAAPDLADDPTLLEFLWRRGWLRDGAGREIARRHGWLDVLNARGA
jgi:hypothetical protein